MKIDEIQNRKNISLVGEVGRSLRLFSPDLTKDETPDHAVDYRGHSISLLLVN